MASVKINGAALKVIRTRSGLSLRQLAELSGVSFRHIGYMEQGQSASWPVVQKIAEALKILPTALLADPAGSSQDTAEVAS